MAKETIYVVRAWVRGKRGVLLADPPIPMTAEDAALRWACRLVLE